MSASEDERSNKYKLQNTFEAMFPTFKKERVADITDQLVSIFRNRTQGMVLSNLDESYYFDMATQNVPINLLRIEPIEYGENSRTKQRYLLIDFTDPTLWSLITKRYHRIVIGKPAIRSVERDVYYPIFKELPLSQEIQLQRLEIYNSVFTQDMLNAIASMKLKSLILQGLTHTSDPTGCYLMVNPFLETIGHSILGEKPLRLNFAGIKVIDTVCLGGSIAYRHAGSVSNAAVELTLTDLYVIEWAVNVHVRNLVLLVSGTDLASGAIDMVLSKFVHVDRVFLCLDSCGGYFPLFRNVVVVKDDFHAFNTVAPDPNTRVSLSTVLNMFENYKVRHMGFDAGFIKEFMINVDINTLLPHFCTIECENVILNGEKKYPLVFSDNGDVSVWTWAPIKRETVKGTHPIQKMPSLSKINNYSFSVSPDPVFYKNFYLVLNRKDSDVTMPKAVVQISLDTQAKNLIAPPVSLTSKVKSFLGFGG
jgi:hypothetical protein